MNIENLKLWIQALRSGEYAQATGRLYLSPERAQKESVGRGITLTPGYCCLGVACEVSIKNGLDLPVLDSADGRRSYGEEQETAFLPAEVSDWLEVDKGLENIWVSAPHLDPEYPGRSYSLTELNDEFHLSFTEIADILEDNFIKDGNE